MTLPRLRREPRLRLGRTGPFHLLPCSVPVAARDKHLYVIGTTGTGKSKFLEDLMVEDILAGHAVGLVDPDIDLSRDTLRHLASRGYFSDESAFQRIIYFDPTQTDFVIAFNVLRTNAPPYAIADMVITAFRRTWPEASSRLGKMTTMSVDLTWLLKA